MAKRRSRSTQVLAVALSTLLILPAVPLAACAPAAAPEGGNATPVELPAPRSASEDPGGSATASVIDYDTSTYVTPEKKWEGEDDGSDMLDVVETHVNESAASRVLTVRTEDGSRFTEALSVDAVAPTGGMADWTVVAVERVSDEEARIEVARPAEVSSVAQSASLAGLSFAAACIEQAIPEDAEAAETDEFIGDMRAEIEAAGEANESFIAEDEEAGLAEAAADATYEVAVPFVHPSLAVDVADTQVGEGATTYRIVASEFAFPAEVAAADFSVSLSAAAPEGVATPVVQNVARVNDFEVEVTVAGDASAKESALDFAALTVAAPSNGTGGEVSCPLVLPDVWADADVLLDGKAIDEHAEEAAEGTDAAGDSAEGDEGSEAADSAAEGAFDEITVQTTLHNADSAASEENVVVSVLGADGAYREAQPTEVDVDARSAELTFDAQQLASLAAAGSAGSAGDAASVVADPGEAFADGADAEPAANGVDEGDPEPTANGAAPGSPAAETESALARDAADEGLVVLSVDVAPAAPAYGGQEHDPAPELMVVPLMAATVPAAVSLSPAEEAALVSSTLVNTAKGLLGSLASMAWNQARTTFLADTVFGDRSNADIYNKLVAVQGQMNDMTMRLDTLADRESAHYNANVVNNANKTLARIQSECTLISGLYENALEAETPEERTARLQALIDENKAVIDAIVVDMGVLYSTIKVADASTGDSLIEVYDSMAEKAYNWGAAAAGPRRTYRDTLSDAWAQCALMLYTVCGDDGLSNAVKVKYRPVLDDLQAKTSDVNAVVQAHPVDASQFEKAAGTYTLKGDNKFMNATGSAYLCNTTGEWYAPMTGASSVHGWDNVWIKLKVRRHNEYKLSDSPFIGWDTHETVPSWDTYYAGRAQIDRMQARSPRTRSLQEEIRSFAPNAVAPHLLVGNAKFDWYHTKPGSGVLKNNWYFGMYDETSPTAPATYSASTQVFGGTITWPSIKTVKKEETSRTNHTDLMVLAKVK